MYSNPASAEQRFRLDQSRLSAHLIAERDLRFGIEPDHPDGFAAAIAERFGDAAKAGAITGPCGVEVAVHVVTEPGLIVSLRDRGSSPGMVTEGCRVSTRCLHPDEVACFGDERFLECCTAIEQLLGWANALMPGLRAMQAAPPRRPY